MNMQRMRAACLATMTSLMIPTVAYCVIKPLSRANCLGFVNESVTYDRPYFQRFQGSAASYHIPQGNTDPKHLVSAPNSGTFASRFYAGDRSDPERMAVHGVHTWITAGGMPVIQRTATVDCNLGEW